MQNQDTGQKESHSQNNCDTIDSSRQSRGVQLQRQVDQLAVWHLRRRRMDRRKGPQEVKWDRG